jgi:hypothetical protein
MENRRCRCDRERRDKKEERNGKNKKMTNGFHVSMVKEEKS